MIGLKILGVLLILAGIAWGLLCLFAAGMADRQVDTWQEIVKPAALGLVPIVIGALLLT